MAPSERGGSRGDDRASSVLGELRRRHEPAGGRSVLRDGLVAARALVVGAIGRFDPRAVMAVGFGAVVLSVGVAAVVVRAGSGPAEAAPKVTVPAATVASTTTVTAGPGVVVQAAGAVRSPGVYRLPLGARVVDLLDRAGGPAADLDLERTNLAALLVDGTRVWLPRVGENVPMVVGGAAGDSRSSPALVDINHATVDQLDALPGIGPSLAAAIVADREKRGSFRSVDDLGRVKGLTRSKIDALRDLVLVG